MRGRRIFLALAAVLSLLSPTAVAGEHRVVKGSKGDEGKQDGEDVLTGGDGSDSLNGGKGNDVLEGDGQNFGGGPPEDPCQPAPAETAVTYQVPTPGAGNDRINGGRGNDDARGGAGNDRIKGGKGTDTIDGGTGADRLNAKGDGRKRPGDSVDCGAPGDGRDVVLADRNDTVEDCDSQDVVRKAGSKGQGQGKAKGKGKTRR